jgi:hypothetical protein
VVSNFFIHHHLEAGTNYKIYTEDINGVMPFDADVIETLARLEERQRRPQTTNDKTIDNAANGDDDENADSDNENKDTEHPHM